MNKSIHILLLFFAGLTLNVQSQTDSKVPPNLKGKMLFEEIFLLQKKRIYNALLHSNSQEVVNFNNVLKKIINE